MVATAKNNDEAKRVCKGRRSERGEGDTDSEGEGEYGTWVREEMVQLEEQGEWEQNWEEPHERGKRRREWDEGGWEVWEMEETGVAAKISGRMQVRGSQAGESVRGNDGGKEGNEGVEGGRVDVEGDGGDRERVNLTVKDQAPKRRALRGRRRGAKREAKDKEDKSLALSLAHWLVKNPPRTLQN